MTAVRISEDNANRAFHVETLSAVGTWQAICDENGEPIDLAGDAWDGRDRLRFRSADAAIEHFTRAGRILHDMPFVNPDAARHRAKPRTERVDPDRVTFDLSLDLGRTRTVDHEAGAPDTETAEAVLRRMAEQHVTDHAADYRRHLGDAVAYGMSVFGIDPGRYRR